MKLPVILLSMLVIAAAPVLAEEINSGFGPSFAEVPHPAFSDPVASGAAAVEPAAGAEAATVPAEADPLLQPSFEDEPLLETDQFTAPVPDNQIGP